MSPYGLTVTTFCDSLCVDPNKIGPAPDCTAVCGDGILDLQEDCDNGNKPGCESCLIVKGYTCLGNIGGSSICNKYPLCGDSILD